MCGIVGYVGPRPAVEVVVSGLKRLEYRGYDSAGVAVYQPEPQPHLALLRSVGKLHQLTERLQHATMGGSCGIGHTRWATHGGVTEANAHPHSDQQGRIVLVQNGIVENYLELKERLIEQGHVFRSQTDTEVIAHLVGRAYAECGSLELAVRQTLDLLHGGNAIVAMCVDEPDMLVAARLGNAGGVVIGLGDGETIIASDIPAVLDYTHQVLFLEDRELAVITRAGVRISTLAGERIQRAATRLEWDPVSAARGDYEHYMLKEIFEQPRALMDVLRGRIDVEAGRVTLDGLHLDDTALRQINRVCVVACGTAMHAGLVGKFMIEMLAGVRVDVDYGSEFRYRQPVLDEHTLVLAITQSGETVDTLAALEEARHQGIPSAAIVNVVGSQATRIASGGAIYLHAGPEIGVASTKCFTSMLVACYLFALRLAQAHRRLSADQIRSHLQALVELPSRATQVIEQAQPMCVQLAEQYHHVHSALYLGRQMNYPIALEGALKLKEISYIHAEGYPAGEMKHGPIALIDEHLPVICIAPRDTIYEKMLSNIEQVKARGGQVIAIATEGDELLAQEARHVLSIPETSTLLTPVLTIMPLQLLAYSIALRRGCDVDQPRNLAKSVTVE
ncbi:MAG: glutamine--fructose-6-phosphate transaminase (isomerizing) [Chloroflexaceae bacterium]|nr:glutamine--fructose-6-phosphate transaminase (isomerizing) [Chloroflexaceae bacterium]